MYDYEDSYEETGIDESVVQDALFGMLCGDWAVEDTALESCRVSTFRDAGVMSNDAGLVLRLPDGSAAAHRDVDRLKGTRILGVL